MLRHIVSKRFSRALNLTLFIASLAAGLAGVELFLRWYIVNPNFIPQYLLENYARGYKNRANASFEHQSRFFSYRARTGDLGLRFTGSRPDLNGVPARGILMLGDSFTFGLGVNDKEAFPAVVESVLRAKGFDSAIFNAGVVGYGTKNAYEWLDTFGENVPAVTTALFFYVNDFKDNMQHYTVENGYLTLTRAESPVFFYARQLVFHVVTLNLLKRHLMALPFIGDAALGDYYPSEDNARYQEMMSNTGEYILKINRLCERQGRKFMVFFVPPEKTVYGAGPDYYRRLKNWLDGKRIIWRDPTADFVKEKGVKLYDGYTMHFTPAGNALMAQSVAAALLEGISAGKENKPPR